MNGVTTNVKREDQATERMDTLSQLTDWLEPPMVVLSFVWLALLILELVWDDIRLFEIFGAIIWIIFIAEFLVRLTLAPEKFVFLRRNWLTVIALAVPAVRLLGAFRIFRVARAARIAAGARCRRRQPGHERAPNQHEPPRSGLCARRDRPCHLPRCGGHARFRTHVRCRRRVQKLRRRALVDGYAPDDHWLGVLAAHGRREAAVLYSIGLWHDRVRLHRGQPRQLFHRPGSSGQGERRGRNA